MDVTRECRMVMYGPVWCHLYGVTNMCAAYRNPWNFSAITLIKVFENTTSQSPKMQPTDAIKALARARVDTCI